MKAVRIHAFGGPEKLVVEEIPEPKLKPNHALVRVVAAGVNPPDWMIREHWYNPKGADRVPMIVGQDFAGVIERIAKGARTRFREGDEVFGEVWGAFAEHIVVPLKDLVKKPANLDFVTAASLPMSALTAYQAVIRTARPRVGTRFLIFGAGGGVGSFAAQFALWKGAEVIAVASRANKDFLHEIGVDEVIDYERQRFDEKVRDVDVVIEHFGGELQQRALRVMKRGGMLINLVGDVDRRAARKAGVEAVEFGMSYDTRDLARIAKLVADGVIISHISKVLRLDQARRALDLNQENRSHGKIVLRVAA